MLSQEALSPTVLDINFSSTPRTYRRPQLVGTVCFLGRRYHVVRPAISMDLIKKPFTKLKQLGGSGSPSRSSSMDVTRETADASPSSIPAHHPEQAQVDAAKHKRSEEAKHRKHEAKREQDEFRKQDEKFLREGPEELTRLYRPLSLNMSKKRDYEMRFKFGDLDIESRHLIFSSAPPGNITDCWVL